MIRDGGINYIHVVKEFKQLLTVCLSLAASLSLEFRDGGINGSNERKG